MRRQFGKISSAWRYSASIGLICNALFLVFLLLKPGSHTLFLTLDTLFIPFYLFLVIIDLLFTAWRARRYKQLHGRKHAAPSSRRAVERWGMPLFVGAALGQLLGSILPVLPGHLSHPWTDICNLSSLPLILLFCLLLPARRFSRTTSVRLVLDSAMLMLAVCMFSWYFLIGPLLFQSGTVTLDTFMMCLYPGSDLAALLCLILVVPQIDEAIILPAIRFLLPALGLLVINDSIVEYLAIHTIYVPGTALDVVAPIAFMLFVLAIQYMQTNSFLRLYDEKKGASASWEPAVAQQYTMRISMGYALLPYLLVPAFVALSFFVLRSEKNDVVAIGVYICTTLLFLLILLRQILAMREFAGFAKTTQFLNEELSSANQRLEVLASTDPLTALPNHRVMVELLKQELAQAEQQQHSCSLLFFDLDHFKAVNDSYGHAGGDTALKEFAALLRAKLGDHAHVGRWGGEEFVAILPAQDTVAAAYAAEELRRAVEQHIFDIGGGMSITCSIGVASYPLHSHEQEALLRAADGAMYGAKRLGRNQVRVVDENAVKEILNIATAGESRDEAMLMGIVQAFSLLLHKHDEQDSTRAQRVGSLVFPLAQALGLSETEARFLALAGQLQDIGKIAFPDLRSQEEKAFTTQELGYMRQHPQLSAEIVSAVPALRALSPIILSHHERWDGKGYPNRQAREALPFGARLLSIVNMYVEVTDGSLYPEPQKHQQALVRLRQGAGSLFDPALVEQVLLLLPGVVSHLQEETEAA